MSRKMNKKFPLIADSNCIINVRTRPCLPNRPPSLPATAVQRSRFKGILMSPYVDGTITVGNQRGFFMHFTGNVC